MSGVDAPVRDSAELVREMRTCELKMLLINGYGLE
jgi:hypothetical protein